MQTCGLEFFGNRPSRDVLAVRRTGIPSTSGPLKPVGPRATTQSRIHPPSCSSVGYLVGGGLNPSPFGPNNTVFSQKPLLSLKNQASITAKLAQLRFWSHAPSGKPRRGGFPATKFPLAKVGNVKNRIHNVLTFKPSLV